jgi:NodT family efflux transporter outer membrane factor (OMF) lipoprotein
LASGLVLALAACTATGPPTSIPIAAPPQWYAPLPHNGNLSSLLHWWQQQDDALLVELIEAAQRVSPSVITARSNILQAQATRAISEAALLPTLDGVGSVGRSTSAPISRTAIPPATNSAQLGLQTAWELDLFGQNYASLEADKERLAGTQAAWHEARVSVAAEVAKQYYSLRANERLLLLARADTRSRAATARLNEQLTKAGFVAPATAALARASAAEGRTRLTQQQALCELDLKALVALTALAEPALRQKLAQAPAAPDQRGLGQISSVPAEVLAQRPDVYRSARELAAASFEVGSARAQRYPRLSISGAITANQSRTRGFTQRFNTWSIGPLALTVPIYDGGAADGTLDAAKARYEEAVGSYQGTVRQAVREVEEALVQLQSTEDRAKDTSAAATGYRASFVGTQARHAAGLASLVELEEARRTLLSARSAVVNLELERRRAWIALYRALGGGWTVNAEPAAPMVFDIPESLLPPWPYD